MKFASKELEKIYPSITKFMSTDIPKVKQRCAKQGGKLKTWEAFHIACGSKETPASRKNAKASLDKARLAISSGGKAPIITVTETSKIKDGSFRQINAFYRKGGNIIYLDDEIANVCEYLMQKKGAKALKAIKLLESTLLHEAVHWARYMSGLRTGDVKEIKDTENHAGRGKNKKYEPGKFFERAAYGKDIDRSLVRSFVSKLLKARRHLKVKDVQRGGKKRTERGIPQRVGR